jgi:SAM-dependent MidA family methyltransferase
VIVNKRWHVVDDGWWWLTLADGGCSKRAAAGCCWLMQMADAEPLRILEFGAGSGKLALDVMIACEAAGKPVAEYVIVELSAQLRARQQSLLKDFSCVSWLNVPPKVFRGTVLCNEVLDAMPVSLLIKKQGRWLERGVGWQGSSFCFIDREVEQEIEHQIPDADALPESAKRFKVQPLED